MKDRRFPCCSVTFSNELFECESYVNICMYCRLRDPRPDIWLCRYKTLLYIHFIQTAELVLVVFESTIF